MVTRTGERRRTGPIRRGARGVVWSAFYLVLVVAPLLVLASGLVERRASGWWFDFSMGLGFGGLALFGGQFVLTARFRRATAPFGMDVLYVLHRWLAVIGLGLVLAHWLILRAAYPRMFDPAWPGSAPLHMTAGRLALFLLVVLLASSLWRKQLRIPYGGWRISHVVLAVAMTALSLAHVLGVGYHSGIPWTRFLLDLFLGSLVLTVAYLRLIKPLLLMLRPYKVVEVRPEPGRCWRLRLEPDGHPGLTFEPGQFAWLSLGTSPLRAEEHPFSFSGPDDETPSLEFTIKELGDFTRTVGSIEVGTLAYVDGPHGVFSVDRYPRAPGFLFVAGGVGIAPIVSMLRSLAARGDRRPLALVYGSRARSATPHLDTIEGLRDALDLHVSYVFEEPEAGWTGRVGQPDPDVIGACLAKLPSGVRCFLCGPVPLTEMAEETLVERGVPLRRIHTELFEMA